jgi:transcriptional regulator with XRE-family HTH domain
MDLKQLGQQIKEHRERQDLTQKDLGEMVDTKKTGISRIESGKQNICFDTLSKIATALNCDLEIIIKPR